MPYIIDGKAISKQIKDELRDEVEKLTEAGINACLAVIQVGNDPASTVYVNNKKKACAYVGINSRSYELPEDTSEQTLLDLVQKLNEDPEVNGILVQLPLPEHGAQFRVPDIDLHHRAAGCQFPHPGADAFGQQEQHEFDIFLIFQISGCGCGVAHRLDIGDMIRSLDRGYIQTSCERAEYQTHLAKAALQHILRTFGQPADGADPDGPQFFGGGRPHIEQILHRQGIDNFFVVAFRDLGNGVWLFVVTAQFGGDLVVGNPNAGRDPQLELDPIADLSGDGHGGTIQPHAARHIKPAFIQTK